MPISQVSSGTVSLTSETINIGNVGIFNNTGSTINPMTLTTGSISFSNSSGTVQSVFPTTSTVQIGSLPTTSTIPVTFGTGTGGGATSTVVSVGTSASTLLSASATRVYAHFRHATVSTGTIFIRHGLVPTTTNYDTYLNMTNGGGDTYEITQTNLWTGDMQAISSVNTSSISIVAF